MKKFMAALLAFAAVILFAGCGGKTVDIDSTLQGESIYGTENVLFSMSGNSRQ